MNELEKQLAEFKQSLESKSLEELQELEQNIISEAQEMDKAAAEKTFNLKETNGNKLSVPRRTSIGKMIASFLARGESNWQQALTIKYLIDYWQSKDMTVPYPVLDNTLRMLGNVQFSGIDDIQNVTVVNDFFEAIREEFMAFTNQLFEIANKHEAVMNEINLRTAPAEEKKPVED